MAAPLKTCAGCNKPRLPEGGVETRPGRWLCATCWARRAARKATP